LRLVHHRVPKGRETAIEWSWANKQNECYLQISERLKNKIYN
jgi:hypothetical protein